MAFCPNCGTQVTTGRFCPNCGTDVSGVGSAAPPPPGSFSTPPPGSVASAPGLSDNVASLLCYVFGFVTGIIFLLIAPYNRNRTVRFHAFQSIFFSVGVLIVRMILFAVLFGGHMYTMGSLLLGLFSLAMFILWIYLMIMAYQNKKIVLPVIGPLAEKQA